MARIAVLLQMSHDSEHSSAAREHSMGSIDQMHLEIIGRRES
jgi:hypothetical protein